MFWKFTRSAEVITLDWLLKVLIFQSKPPIWEDFWFAFFEVLCLLFIYAACTLVLDADVARSSSICQALYI